MTYGNPQSLFYAQIYPLNLNPKLLLFITKILGTAILKLKYKDIVYAVLRRANEKFFRVQTSEGEWLFFFDNFNELKEAIEEANSRLIIK